MSVRSCKGAFDMNEIIQAYDVYAYWTEMELNAIMIVRLFSAKRKSKTAPQ